MEALAAELDATHTTPAHVSPFAPPASPTGALDIDGINNAIAALIPENAIIVDESVTAGRNFSAFSYNSAPHDVMSVMGGSIGWGLAAGVGAGLAAPARKTLVLEGDGSAMYTIQALWTMARENLNCCVVIFANRAYRILQGEFKNVGAGQPGLKAHDMLTLDRPNPDWVALARGYGVDASRATTLEEFTRELRRGLAVNGPYLVELIY
jgi:acetolactate synthase-1/2/3 large subunit